MLAKGRFVTEEFAVDEHIFASLLYQLFLCAFDLSF
jgi:hypothetical protein